MNRKIEIDLGHMTLTGTSDEFCLHLNDSYKIKKSKIMHNIIMHIKSQSDESELIHNLSIRKAIREWKGHNLLYNLNILYISFHARSASILLLKQLPNLIISDS